MLIAPCLVLLAYWYRRQLSQTLMIWKNPEMVIVTITFSVAALILFIVGTSSFFTYYDVLSPSSPIQPDGKEKFFTIGVICLMLLVALMMIYIAIRLLLVRVITEKGVVLNDRVFRAPNFRHVIEWHQISDYYLVSDYPTVIFTLITQKQPLQFDRTAIRVPVYIRDDFEDLLEAKMYSAQAVQNPEDRSTQQFSEN